MKPKRKPGRPPLPKGQAKGGIVRVRLTTDAQKRIEAAAKAQKQSVSEWIRNMLEIITHNN
jgi:predicted HicB family RNase H-like nuclease